MGWWFLPFTHSHSFSSEWQRWIITPLFFRYCISLLNHGLPWHATVKANILHHLSYMWVFFGISENAQFCCPPRSTWGTWTRSRPSSPMWRPRSPTRMLWLFMAHNNISHLYIGKVAPHSLPSPLSLWNSWMTLLTIMFTGQFSKASHGGMWFYKAHLVAAYCCHAPGLTQMYGLTCQLTGL